MIDNWPLFAIAAAIYGVSCLFPLWAQRTKDPVHVGLIAATDLTLTGFAIVAAIVAFENVYTGAFLVVGFYLAGTKIYGDIVGDNDPYKKRREP